jgi:uncharacterized lipoprotein YmbA
MLYRCTPALTLAISALTGCTQTPVHLYTLAPYSKNVAATLTKETILDPFVIERVSIPPSVDRKSLVLRSSARELVLLENENWASPLRDEVRRTLAIRIHHALELKEDRRGSETLTRIRVDIREWDATSRDVQLDVAWRLQRMDSANPIDVRCEMRLNESTSGTPDDLVRADQALLDAIANAMVQGMDSARCSGG